jgi:CrcB protein
MAYLWVLLGSAIGGLLRYIVGIWTIPVSGAFPTGTLIINVIGSFVIGYFGTLTLQSGRHPASDNLRLFVMVGLCGGFTTFSSFSLQTYDLLRSGHWGRALANVVISSALGLAAVAAGHYAAMQPVSQVAITETAEEELTS